MAFLDRLDDMWRDQQDLNRLFRPSGPPTDYAERTALTKEMVLHLLSEAESLLQASGAWKPHRRIEVRENRPAILNELTDLFKYLVTLYQIWDFTPDEVAEAWRRKTMVVRQRHAEEWVHHLDRPSVVVDLDQVLADYAVGFMDHIEEVYPRLRGFRKDGWIDYDTFKKHISHDDYQSVRHAFCVLGKFGTLPLMPGAKAFMDWVRDEGYQIIILTSRPIHQYPTIYTDTLVWLDQHQLPFDFIWWTADKGRMLLDRNVATHVAFAVDDNYAFVRQLADVGIHTFWLNKGGQFPPGDVSDKIEKVDSLIDLVTRLQGETA